MFVSDWPTVNKSVELVVYKTCVKIDYFICVQSWSWNSNQLVARFPPGYKVSACIIKWPKLGVKVIFSVILYSCDDQSFGCS